MILQRDMGWMDESTFYIEPGTGPAALFASQTKIPKVDETVKKDVKFQEKKLFSQSYRICQTEY